MPRYRVALSDETTSSNPTPEVWRRNIEAANEFDAVRVARERFWTETGAPAKRCIGSVAQIDVDADDNGALT